MFIQMGEKEKAENCLKDILHYYETLNVSWRDFVSVSLTELIFDISDIMMKTKIQEKLWENENVIGYFREHFAHGTLQDAYETILAYVQKCCRQFSEMNESQGERIVFQVKELVEKNLDNEEFGIETVSEKLFFSYNYVRQIFKKVTGESLMEYLIRRRMEKARELLKNDNIKTCMNRKGQR